MKIISARQFNVLFDRLFRGGLVKSASFANLITKLEQALEASKGLSGAAKASKIRSVSGITIEMLDSLIAKNSDEFLSIYRSLNSENSAVKAIIDSVWAKSGRTQSIEEFASATSKAGGGGQLSILPQEGTALVRSTPGEMVTSVSRMADDFTISIEELEIFRRNYYANKSQTIRDFGAMMQDPNFQRVFKKAMENPKVAEIMLEIVSDWQKVKNASVFDRIRGITQNLAGGGYVSGLENAPETQRLIAELDTIIKQNPEEALAIIRGLDSGQADIVRRLWSANRGVSIDAAIARAGGGTTEADDAVRALTTGVDDAVPTGTRLPSGTDDATRAATGIVDDTGRATGVTDDASRAGAAGGLPSAGTRLSYVIDESDDLGTILSKLETRPIDLTKREAAIIRRIMNKNGEEFAAKLLSEESGKLKAFLTKYNNNGELGAILLEAEDIIRRNPNAVATLIREAPAASAVARQINWGRAARVSAGIAAGLGGIALISFIMGDDDEEPAPAPQSTGGGSGSVTQSGSGQTTGGPTTDLADRYRAASKLMMDKGYLTSIQSSWTEEFDAGFRPFIDTGTKNNRALRPTNLVGGQTWPQVAPTIGFSPDEKGALSAVSLLSKFVPSMGGKGVGERREETPQVGPGDTRATNKEDVLADIISRLYNNRLVEGGGGIFSNDLKQTQTLVDAVGGGTPAGYRNAARIILSRNPGLTGMLPETLISDVLTKQNIRRHPAYMGAKKTQETIHQIFEAANPGLINPGRVKATENISAYLSSPAGGNWKSASAKWNKMVKLAEDRKARIRENILKDLTPAEKAIIRRNKMREI